MTEHVLVMHDIRPKALTRLEAAYTLHRYDLADDKPAFLALHGPKCRAVATNGHVALTAADLEHLPNVGIVACSSAGYEYIDVEALKARGIHFTNSSPALSDDVADLAVLLTLAARRELVAAHDYVRSGEWGRTGMYPLLHPIKGLKAGIVGLGQIGQAIARRLEPFGLEIGYTARSRKPVEHVYFPDSLALAEWADVLIVIVPGGPETENLIDARVMAALGPGGTLVNVARGSVVDETALIEALSAGTLGSAALDVFAEEPSPNPALVALPNLTLYPHHASGTVETRDAMAMTVVDNIAAYFAGEDLSTPVYSLP